MPINEFQVVANYCLTVAGLAGVSTIAVVVRRMLSKPRGTYGNGLPERRRRPRLVLPDPATLRPRPAAPGATI